MAEVFRLFGTLELQDRGQVALRLQQIDERARHLRDTLGEAERQSLSLGRRLSDSLERAASASRSVALAVAGFAAGLGAAAASGLRFSAWLERTEMGLETLLGSSRAARAFLDELKRFAEATPFELPGLVDAARRLMAMGFAAQDVIPTLRAVGDAVAAMGGSAEVVDRVTLALGQMMAKGKVSAEEMLQLTEAGIPAWDMLAERIGVSVPQAMRLAEKGAIDAATAIDALVRGMNERFGGAMERQARTMEGLWSTLKDRARLFLADAVQPLFELLKRGLEIMADFAAGDRWETWRITARRAMAALSVALAETWDVIVPLGRVLAAHADVILPALAGAIAGALIPSIVGWTKALIGLLRVIGPWSAGVALLAMGVTLLIRHWGGFREFWTDLWRALPDIMRHGLALILDAEARALEGLSKLFALLGNRFWAQQAERAAAGLRQWADEWRGVSQAAEEWRQKWLPALGRDLELFGRQAAEFGRAVAEMGREAVQVPGAVSQAWQQAGKATEALDDAALSAAPRIRRVGDEAEEAGEKAKKGSAGILALAQALIGLTLNAERLKAEDIAQAPIIAMSRAGELLEGILARLDEMTEDELRDALERIGELRGEIARMGRHGEAAMTVLDQALALVDSRLRVVEASARLAQHPIIVVGRAVADAARMGQADWARAQELLADARKRVGELIERLGELDEDGLQRVFDSLAALRGEFAALGPVANRAVAYIDVAIDAVDAHLKAARTGTSGLVSLLTTAWANAVRLGEEAHGKQQQILADTRRQVAELMRDLDTTDRDQLRRVLDRLVQMQDELARLGPVARPALELVRGLILAVDDALQRTTDDTVSLSRVFWDALAGQARSTADLVASAAVRMHQSLVDAFTNAYRAIITGTESFGQALRNLWNAVLNAIANRIAEFLASKTVDALLGLLGGLAGGGAGGGGLLGTVAGAVGGVVKAVGNVVGGAFRAIGKLFGFAHGGVVPGALGAPRLILAHGGETVLTPQQVDVLAARLMGVRAAPDVPLPHPMLAAAATAQGSGLTVPLIGSLTVVSPSPSPADHARAVERTLRDIAWAWGLA